MALCEVYDIEGRRLAKPVVHESGEETWIEPVANGVRYVLLFSDKPTWVIAPAQDEAVAGGAMPLKMTGATPIAAQSDKGQVRDRQLLVPENLPVGTWITVRGTAGGQTYETRLRVCAPVQWRSRVVEHYDDTHLFLTPSWNLKGTTVESLSVALTVPPGWDVKTRRFAFKRRTFPRFWRFNCFPTRPRGRKVF